MDGDGDIDVLSASFEDNKIAWYENNGSQGFTAHAITTAANGAISVFAIDMDGDGDVDVLSASASDDKIACYENVMTRLLGMRTTAHRASLLIPLQQVQMVPYLCMLLM